MRKLRIVLAGILLTMPLFALNASSFVDDGEAVEAQAPSVTGSCWYFYNGRWYVFPC